MSIFTEILRGDHDADLDRISTAIRERRKSAGRENLFELVPGDRVRIRGIRPAYLNGLHGTVTGTRNSRISVRLDQSVGRFSGTFPLAVPASCVEKVA
jgi:hypothetical protein